MIISRALLKYNNLIRLSRAPFAKEDGEDPTSIELPALQEDLKAELAKKFTGEIRSISFIIKSKKNFIQKPLPYMTDTCKSVKSL